MSAHVLDLSRDVAMVRYVEHTFPVPGDGPPIIKKLIEHPDGVYINLPELDYLNDWALSYSAFKLLLSSPPDWHWESLFNLLVDQTRTKETSAMRFGSALHAALLESLQAYDRRYGIRPSADTHPKALRTQDDLKKRLTEAGLKTSGSKPQQIDRLLEAEPDAVILDVLQAEWDQQRLIPMTVEEDAQLRLMVELAKRHPALVQAFGGTGLSEVSTFWTDDNGVRQRIRLDRAKPNASIDLKSFSNWMGRDFHKALLREAALRMYDLQAAHYDVGRHETRRLVLEGKVFVCFEERIEEREIHPDVAGAPVLIERWGVTSNRDGEVLRERRLGKDDLAQSIILPADEETLALARAVFGSEVWEWIWIFYKTDGAPTAQPVRLDRSTKAFQRGAEMRDKALAAFLFYRELFGLERAWLRLEPMWTPGDEDWPFFMAADV